MKNEKTTCRKKLYKSGKLWVAAGILSFGLAVQQQVYADTTHGESTTQVVAATNVDTSVSDTPTVTDAGAKDATTSHDNVIVHDDQAANSTQTNNQNQETNHADAVTAPTDVAQTDSTAQVAPIASTNSDDTQVDVTTGTVNDVNNNQPDADKGASDQKSSDVNHADTQTNVNKDASVSNTNNTDKDVNTQIASDKDAGNQTDPTQDTNEQRTTDKKNDDNQDITDTTTNNPSAKNDKRDTNTPEPIQYSSKNIQTVNGQTVYVDDNGQIKKNFTAIVDGHVLYFDKDNGFLVPTDDYKFKQGLTSQNDNFSQHNAVHDDTADSFTDIDGYLTADSWYRPTDILTDGKNWTPSTDNDFRPLLMSWWPDKVTQVNYLNYMKNAGLSQHSVDFTDEDDQSDLNKAAHDIQANIEQKISQDQQTDWLKQTISNFVDSQPNWNIASEYQTTGDDKDHLQGGALLYVNSDKTPDANSDYRLLNRTPTNQKGYYSYSEDPTQGGYDFLLANDVDNSNPVVQAEQLNWLYYLLNFGSITNQDADANFDSIRVDAVDNVDADLLQIQSDYMKAAYGVDKDDATANQHLSILEDWSDNDAQYVKDHGDNQLSMDNKLRLSLKYSLTMPVTDQDGHAVRSGLEPLITNSLVNRTVDDTDNTARPNYSFVRAHDSEVQTVIAEIIKQKINPNSDGLTPTQDELTQAFKIYNADQLKTDKEFTQFNIPSTYALLLTNKDTVPRVYYGDLFTDDGQYMANKSPYYDAINTLLQSRLKYVAGGQTMAMHYVTGDSSMAADSNHGVLTSVRYGKGAMSATDEGTSETRTQGLAVIEANNPDLKLSQSDQIVVTMGAAHKNQAYRPILLTTKDGLVTEINQSDTDLSKIKYTNGDGQLIFDASEIQGVANPQVSGYLAVWAPVDAQDTQDARTADSELTSINNGQTLHSNAALDSQVIYESFSNFQSFPTNADEYTNTIIAKNTQLYKDWGITSFEFAPQYRSSTEGSFLDSIIQNGYAFTDRYDLGFNIPTKYGTVDELRDAIKSLHASGIKAMADWVPDQIYNLTGQQVVTAERVNNSGVYNNNSVINKTLYAAKTVGGGDYQKQYGGAFLDTIKSQYPSLFTTNQISTGVPMDPSEKIQEWSAKYFNGSNIQGRGAYYVLKDWATNDYFKVASGDKNAFLPKQLVNQTSNTGFVSDDKGMTYFSTSGYQAKDTFIQDKNSNWYYFDKNGYMTYSFQKINGATYYFLPNGVELQDAYLTDADGNTYYFNQQGKQAAGDYFMDSQKQWRYFDKNGVMANKGLTTIKIDQQTHVQYFNSDGIQVKGQLVTSADGQLRYFSADSGDMLTDQFKQLEDNSWVYFGSNGVAVKGQRTIQGQKLYFDDNYRQIKGHEYVDNQGRITYYDADSGEMIVNRFEKLSNGDWAYFGANGRAVKGSQAIKGQKLYFDDQYNQIKGHEYVDNQGRTTYYDADSGEMIVNRFEKLTDGSWFYFGANGRAVKGNQTINGQNLFFDDNYHQIKGQAVTDKQGKTRYYDADSGEMVTDRFERLSDGSWQYFGVDGVMKMA
ncbi:glucosyltransferase-S [Leuconostoc kimchii IMSNU 11154]|uniref:dextransucrase n=1 Tax=Leuconostoc kimchii (strain IMSNU 11154 / KCTC 2386 / IH25) TaxID=762051 RepID=D5T4R4_LEUKI|nr:glycoside hydrolase family 70 protein [Leuconostoc kimchii]ADG41535.1 glucosyltransferase-S [Leuconostoc kimchii IMSNU 11154]